MNKKSEKILHLFLLGLCLVLFTSFATTDLALPGPQPDEVTHGALAIDLLRPPFPYGRDYTLRLGDQPFPFGTNPHIGALKAYLLYPLFAAFGPSLELLRVFTVFLGLMTLLFCYAFLSEQRGCWVAFFSTLLLSLDSSFIFYSKLDEGPIMEPLLWMTVCLWSFGRFGRTHQLRYLIIGLMASILGVYSHITFIWFVVSCCFAAAFCFPQEFRNLSKKSILSFVISAALCLVAIFLYWSVGRWTRFLENDSPGLLGVRVVFERLSTMGGIVPEVLLGKHTNVNAPIAGIDARPLTDVFLPVSALLLLCSGGMKSKFFRFFFCMSAIFLVEFAVTPVGVEHFKYHRMMPLYIFLIFFSGTAVAESVMFLGRPRGRSLGLCFISLGLIFLAFVSSWGQITLTRQAQHQIRQTGGRGFWSDATYVIAEVLEREKWETTVCFNAVYNSLVLLGRGRIPLTAPGWIIYVADKGEKREILSKKMQDSSPRVLFLVDYVRKSVTVQEFREVARQIGRNPKLEYFFRDREGEPLYAAYTVH